MAQKREDDYRQCIISMTFFYILENILEKLHISVKSLLKYNILGPPFDMTVGVMSLSTSIFSRQLCCY